MLAFTAPLALALAPPRLRAPRAPRATPRASSLEESKKRARSPYDNIPDLNQLYLRELSRVQREQKLPPAPPSALQPILRPDGTLAPSSRRRSTRRKETAPLVPETLPSPEEESEARRVSLAAYQDLRRALLGDTVFVGLLAVCAGWAFGDVATAGSVGLGAVGGVAYVFLLARGVDSMGGAGDLLAPARAAVLALLVVFSAKHRDVLQVLPVLLGFFSYKVATLLPLLTGEGFDES